MKIQQQSARKARTRQLTAAGGLLHKSGLMEAFSITPGDDLQVFETREKAATLLGFLTECFETNEFNDANLKRWRIVGKRLMKGI